MTPRAAYRDLLEYASVLPVIDSHEHLPDESVRVGQHVDFFTLFSHYCVSDLVAAGAARDMQALRAPDVGPEAKWEVFAPYYDRIQDGAYARAAHLAMERFYGLKRLEGPDDAATLTEAIQEANRPGLYQRVLKDACRIEVSLAFIEGCETDRRFFLPVPFMDNFVLTGKEGVWALEDSLGVSCSTLGRYVDAVAQRVAAFKEQGAKGLKLALAYKRDLHFAPRTEAEAEAVYLRILEEGYGWRPHGVGFEEARPLQDYLVHRLCEIAADLELPVVIHSAMQANNYHNADDARPARLWNLVHRHRRTTFVLLHAGFPWFEDAAQLAKHYPNLYLDMTWTYLMSPAISQRGLEMFVDLVPRNKVLGFGGDYAVVENVYGHLVMARETIARALASHVEQHGMPMERARGWARALLHDNPADLYRID